MAFNNLKNSGRGSSKETKNIGIGVQSLLCISTKQALYSNASELP
jgi:hypothetical protein